VFCDLSDSLSNGAPQVAEKGRTMKLRRTKYKHTTPKSQTEFTSVSLDLGGGFTKLLKTVAKIIEKHFGLLYKCRLLNVHL
jgi:transposase